MPWLSDPKTGEKSVTLTMFVAGSVVAILKLLASGLIFQNFHLPNFSGTDFAAVTGALGAVYWARKNTDSKDA